MEPSDLLLEMLRAVHFAADKHRHQRRKDRLSSPYINHPIEVAEMLARVGGVSDLVTLQAAILHDTVEDTRTTPEELEEHFGSEVRYLVEEVTDDKDLPKGLRKQLQIDRAEHSSGKAKLIKIADKICNVRDMGEAPPASWGIERRRQYLDWAGRVVEGCRGANTALESLFDAYLERSRRALGSEESAPPPH